MPEQPRRPLDAVARLGDPDPTPAVPAPPAERDHAFVLRVRTAAGPQEGTCVCRVPGLDDRLRIGRIRARLAGVPWESLDPETRALIDAQATCAVALVERPAWLDAVVDERPDVLLAVYGEVIRHEAEFFRLAARAGGGAAGAALVEVVPVPGAARPPAELHWEAREPGALGAAGGRPAGPPR